MLKKNIGRGIPMRETIIRSAPFKSIPLSRINSLDDTFRITTTEDVSALRTSIQIDGLISPPILFEAGSSHVIVSGFRRIAVCRQLNQQDVVARVLAPDTGAHDCLRLAIAENALQRPLNLIETSRCLQKLSVYSSNSRQLAESAASLGLPSNPAIIDKIKTLCLLPWPIQCSLMTDTISLATAKELESLEPDSARAFNDLFNQLKIGLNKQKEIITLVREIAHRDGLYIQDLLEDGVLGEIAGNPDLDRGQKISRLRTLLRRRRFPAIARTEKNFEMQRKNLKLGEDIKLSPPKDFEATSYELTLRFNDISHFESLQNKLSHLIKDPAFIKIMNRNR